MLQKHNATTLHSHNLQIMEDIFLAGSEQNNQSKKSDTNVIPFPQTHPDNQVITSEFKPTTTLEDATASEASKAIRQIANEIEPGRFYFKSSDKNGHTRTARTRIPPYWENAINYIIGTVKCYKCSSDFFRDAIVHRIAWLVKNVAEIDPHELAVLMSEVMSEKEIMDGVAFESMRKTVDKAIKGVMRRRDWEAAFVLIKQLETTAQGMNLIYRKRILKRLERYRGMIEGKKAETEWT